MSGIFLPGSSKGGDITGVTAGVGLSGGGDSDDVTLTLDLSELSTVTPINGDFFATLDSDGATEQKTSTTALATLFAGDGLTASSAVLAVNVDDSTIETSSDAIRIKDNGVSLAKMAGLTRGSIIYGDTNGDPAALAKGNADQVLTSDGTDIAWADASGGMTSFQLEDGDGTEVAISNAKEVKFIDGDGIDINWTDTDNGTDADPYDLTFALDIDGMTDIGAALASGDLFIVDDGAGGTNRKTTIDRIATLLAGTGLSDSSAVISVDTSQAITALTGGDLTIYEDANNADVSLKMGTSATESLTIQVLNGGSNKTAEEVHFSTATASGTADHGKMVFDIDGVDILTIDDGGLIMGVGAIDITSSGGIILENDETITNSTNGTISFSGGIAIPDAGNIGSASDLDAIAISSGGVVTFSQSVDHALDAHFDSSPADETVSGITATFTAGETLVRGEVVYFKAGDSKMWKAVASAAGTMPVAAMAAADISADATGKFLLYGFLADNGTFPAYTVGGDLYAPEAETSSENVPEQTAPDSDGDFVQVLGYAVTANSVFFDPDQTIVEVA